MRYRTRRLLAGDDYVCSPQRGRLDVAIGKAVYAPAAAEPKPVQHVDSDAYLRARYTELSGSKPSKRWGAARLQKEIDVLTNPSPSAADIAPVLEATGVDASGQDDMPDATADELAESKAMDIAEREETGPEVVADNAPEAGGDDDDQNGSLI